MLRKRMKQLLSTLPDAQRRKEEAEVVKQLFQTSEWQQASIVALTLAMAIEFNLERVYEQATTEDKQLVVPVITSTQKRSMEFYPYTRVTRLISTPYGGFEPQYTGDPVEESYIDLCIVPGLVYSKQGDRVGFGGGYYDRFLARYSGKTVSLAYRAQVKEQADWVLESTDVRIQKLIVQGAIYEENNKL